MRVINPETSQYTLGDSDIVASRRQYAQDGIETIDKVLRENPDNMSAENKAELRLSREQIEQDMASIGLTLINRSEGV